MLEVLRVNGVLLTNEDHGWILRRGTTPYSAIERADDELEIAGRDGVEDTYSTTRPTLYSFTIHTPPSGWQALLALFSQPVLTVTRDDVPGVEIRGKLLSSSKPEVNARNEWVEATFFVTFNKPFWRDTASSTTTVPLSSSVVGVECFGKKYTPWVDVLTNYVPNSQLVGSGTMVEVARNFNPRPTFDYGLSPWTQSGVSTELSTEWAAVGTQSVKVTSEPSSPPNYGDIRWSPASVTPGETYHLEATIMLPAAHTSPSSSSNSRQRRILVFTSTDVEPPSWVPNFGPQAPNTPGEHVLTHTVTIPPDHVKAVFAIGCVGSVTDPSFVTYVDRVLIGNTPQWSSGDYSPDPDLTPRWLGTVGNSTSVLEGERINGFEWFNNCVVIWSSKFGGSARQIPTGTNPDSNMSIPIPTAVRGGGKFAATVNLDAAQLGTLASRARSLTAILPWKPNAVQAPNAPGSYPLEYSFSALTGEYRAVLYNGASSGNGDVYWNKPGLFTDPDGEWFPEQNDELQRTVWGGTPNNSPLTLQTREIQPGSQAISAPVGDAIIRVKGPATGIQITDSGGSWLRLPDVTASQYVRFHMDTLEGFKTTTDTWVGGTDVSDEVDFNGGREIFEITPAMVNGDPGQRAGLLNVTTVTRGAGAQIQVRGKAAYIDPQ